MRVGGGTCFLFRSYPYHVSLQFSKTYVPYAVKARLDKENIFDFNENEEGFGELKDSEGVK